MLLYLTSNNHINTFDFLYDEHGIIIKKLSGQFSLKQFVINDMRNLDHYSFVAIDVQALKDSDIEVIEAVNAFKKLHSSRLIFYVDDIVRHEKLLKELVEIGLYNIATSSDVAELRTEILMTISDLGISKKEIQCRLFKIEGLTIDRNVGYAFVKNNIRIAVTGVQNRVGTTTMAINLANYLAGMGTRVSYIEANDHDHLRQLSAYYTGMVLKEDGIIYNGIKYLSLQSECKDDFDFVIYDMGVVSHKIIGAINNNCDRAILCATGKPYEQSGFEKVQELMNAETTMKVFSLVAEADKPKLLKQYDKVHFSEYTPDYFCGDVNGTIWDEVIKPFVIR